MEWLGAAVAMNDLAHLELRAAVVDALKAGGDPARVARLASLTQEQVVTWGRDTGALPLPRPVDLDERRARRGGDWQRLVAEAEERYRHDEPPE